MEKLPFLSGRKEWGLFVAGCGLLLALTLSLEFRNFQTLTDRKFFDLNATVIAQYQKTNKHGTPYWVLRLTSAEHGTFYTTTYEDLKPIIRNKVRLTLIVERVAFTDYLRGFYAPSFGLGLLPSKPPSLYDRLLSAIGDQHTNELTGQLYGALYLAAPVGKELREAINRYAVAHLVALSGFHLGILSLLIAAIVGWPYRLLQRRFFPWRNAFFDLGAITLAILGGYLVFTGTVPSLLRAFAMLAFGLFLAARHIRLVSFVNLAVVGLFLIALFPRLALSIGFGLSMAGVFFILLYLRYFGHRPARESAVGISLYVFAAMLPVVHFFFPLTTHAQLLSPVLSLLFTLFYPALLLLHLIGFGHLADGALLWALNLPIGVWQVSTPLWLLTAYLVLSIAAIFHRFIHYALMGFLAGWLIWQYGFAAIIAP